MSGACLGHVSLVATPEAPAFFHHDSLFLLCEGAVDPTWRVDHHGDCSTTPFVMGLSLWFEGSTPFAFSLSKPRLFLFLRVEAAQSEPYVVFRMCHVFPFVPGLGIVLEDDILSQGVREALSKEVQSAFLIQSISHFGSQGLESGDIGIKIYALHVDAVQLCCCILLFGGVHKGLIELSDEMSPIDQIGGGNLNMVGVSVTISPPFCRLLYDT